MADFDPIKISWSKYQSNFVSHINNIINFVSQVNYCKCNIVHATFVFKKLHPVH